MSKSRKDKKYSPQYLKKIDLSLDFSMNFSQEDIQDFIEKTKGASDSVSSGRYLMTTNLDSSLSICVRYLLINLVQEFTVNVEYDVADIETGEEFELKHVIKVPKMNFSELQLGSKVKIDRVAGIKTRWRGLHEELLDLFKEPKFKRYIPSKAKGRITVRANFLNPICYKEFLKIMKDVEIYNTINKKTDSIDS